MPREKKGLVMIYTGNGKGKTTAALGQAFRAAGHGYRILIINFMKGWDFGEAKAAAYLPNMEVVKAGRETFVDKDNPDEKDLRLAAAGLARAREAACSGDYDLIVLDEINVAVHYNLIPLQEVLELIENRLPEVDLILTGRYVPAEFLEIADLVSEIKEIKHHYQDGAVARKGIEY
ncbi:MAG: cob(I)yrinic acid a,c-diamide adenosyltransferase [Dethiobacteria bacterium]|jgi:cob(I)alamin adenosyltransferase